jgi:hypothetical protein
MDTFSQNIGGNNYFFIVGIYDGSKRFNNASATATSLSLA